MRLFPGFDSQLTPNGLQILSELCFGIEKDMMSIKAVNRSFIHAITEIKALVRARLRQAISASYES